MNRIPTIAALLLVDVQRAFPDLRYGGPRSSASRNAYRASSRALETKLADLFYTFVTTQLNRIACCARIVLAMLFKNWQRPFRVSAFSAST